MGLKNEYSNEIIIDGVYNNSGILGAKILTGFSKTLPYRLSHLLNSNQYESIIEGINQIFELYQEKFKVNQKYLFLFFAYVFLGMGLMMVLIISIQSPAVVIAVPAVFISTLIILLVLLMVKLNKSYREKMNHINQHIISINNSLVNEGIEFTYFETRVYKSIIPNLKVSFSGYTNYNNLISSSNNQPQPQQQQQQQTPTYVTPLNQSSYQSYNFQTPLYQSQQQQQQLLQQPQPIIYNQNLNYSIDINETLK